LVSLVTGREPPFGIKSDKPIDLEFVP
jgi:hypothetical protein